MLNTDETLFIVSIVKEDIKIEVLGVEKSLPLVWADGMIGALPVFKNYDDAFKYAGGDSSLIDMARTKHEANHNDG